MDDVDRAADEIATWQLRIDVLVDLVDFYREEVDELEYLSPEWLEAQDILDRAVLLKHVVTKDAERRAKELGWSR